MYDGFVFTEEKPEYTSGKWFNQYPRASYGQMDDSHNWKVTPDQTEAEINSLPDNKVWATYQDVTVFLGSALRGALNLKEEGKLVESKALSDFYDKVVKLLKDDFKMEVCASTMKLERKDGSTEEIPGLFDIELKPIT